ncbi:hypothetical protein HCN44_002764 [Aphidius gifuensis]|uniref:Uncharacterized protein n=1 Tax=Aphidius gifuensis TaxID=684658 RepID=A0A835CPE8_APHGI|nr:uncharacterized protein MAL13P1.304-like [Aphidius gifuensis]XP_044010961.1 uncharacterized protein MAL13P1.304-like [Aphidius gifuensis]KAF7991202.1 hypothetical protein HCN44_002764 [Aphidius gifuensis]
MDKWISRGKKTEKWEISQEKKNIENTHNKDDSCLKKKNKKWSIGGLFKKKQKQESCQIVSSPSIIYKKSPEDIPGPSNSTSEIINKQTLKDLNINSNNSNEKIRDSLTINQEEFIKFDDKIKTNDTINKILIKNRKKPRCQMKNERYFKSSSDENDDDDDSTQTMHCQSEDFSYKKIDLPNKKRSRGARTERYMKRIYRDDNYDTNKLLKSQKKYLSDTLTPKILTLNNDTSKKQYLTNKSYSYDNNNHDLFNSQLNISLCPTKSYNCYPHIQQNECCFRDNNYDDNNQQPPEPPPRSCKSKIIQPTRYSLQQSDIDITHKKQQQYINTGSLDNDYIKKLKNHDINDDIIMEKKLNDAEKRRYSKNLEEALQELETIYNSLKLDDKDLLDRAEKRCMDEYRYKLSCKNNSSSLKSLSDTSSNDLTKELSWRDDDNTRLNDDMAYRRMKKSSISKTSLYEQQLPRGSYLSSPILLSSTSQNDYKINSNRTTPDLTKDDVAYRCINHSINTLKINDPQPPFGIPIGPVTCSPESDYLHHDLANNNNNNRSIYLPKNEPDIITDDLAFRNLRKDNNIKNNYLIKNGQQDNNKKKKATRSMSADIYGIINSNNNKNKQSTWYKEYVKLNRPTRISGFIDNYMDKYQINDVPNKLHDDDNNDDDNCHRKTINFEEIQCKNKHDIDDNFPHDNIFNNCSLTNEKNIKLTISDKELTEYKQLCHDLENLIMKTSEQVKLTDNNNNNDDVSKTSFDEFIELEEMIKNNVDELNNIDDKISDVIDVIDEKKNSNELIMNNDNFDDDDIELKFQEIYNSTDDNNIENYLPFNSDIGIDKLSINNHDNLDKLQDNKKVKLNDNNDDENLMITRKIEGRVTAL